MVNNLRLTPVLCAALGAAAGFYCYGFASPVIFAVILFILLAIHSLFRALASLSPESRRLQLTVILSAALAVGLFFGVCAANAGRVELKLGIPPEKVIAVEGVLLEDPRIISGGKAMALMSLKKCAGAGGLRVTASGELTVFFPEEGALKLREFGRGTTVFTEGRLRENERGRTYSAVSMHIVKPASSIERMRTNVRLNLINRFEGKSSPGFKDTGGLALALLLGIKDNLDSNLSTMYRNAGCSYILALSGMHLAVLAALIAFLLKKPLGLKTAAIIGAVIICLYCFIVGPMPSLNRAALMYLIGVLAILGAFPREPMQILALSFLLQLAVSPSEGNTISFILSYLALAGILIIGQSLYALFAGKIPDFLLQPFSASCGAFLATTSITCFAFGVLAPIGLITGLALVPLTTVFMIASMIWLTLDMVSLSFILNLPLTIFYRLMEIIVSLTGKVPGVNTSAPFIFLLSSVILSVLIVIFEYRRRASLLILQPFP